MTGRFVHPVPMVVLAESVHYQTANIYDLHVNDFDGLVIPGRYSPDFFADGPPHAAIFCHGPIVLISVDKVMGTDIVRGRKVAAMERVRG